MHRRRNLQTEPPTSPTAWMTTFSDLVMLLLTFFVMLLTMKSMDAGKVREVFDSLIRTTGPLEYLDLRAKVAVVGEDGQPTERVMIQSAAMLENALELMAGLGELAVDDPQLQALKEVAAIREDPRGVFISLSSDALFDSGAAEVRAEQRETLDTIGKVLRYTANDILIIGHTDNQPVRSRRFRSNWDLSLYRGLNVLDYLCEHSDVPPERIVAGGHGAAMPLYPNDTAVNRAKNRRVEFILRKSP